MSVAVILGSAFREAMLEGRVLTPLETRTVEGAVTMHRFPRADGGNAFVLFRHGLPHRWLPHQIPYLAVADALREVGCRALLVTSSVGVLDRSLPLARPLLVGDLLMPENRLPDGRTCTVFQTSAPEQGHLVLEEGLFSAALGAEVRQLGAAEGIDVGGPVIFGYHGGPRTKTSAENALYRAWGAQVNSMSLGPEVVLANERGIATAAVVVGHKYSVAGGPPVPDLGASLNAAAAALSRLVVAFLEKGRPVAFANRLYRFER